jgi:hypothetical protein
MNDFFSNMDSAERIYWYIAIASSLIFIIQTILSFVGSDTDMEGDLDFEADSSSFHLSSIFSFRNLINFLLGFGWTGVAFYNTIENKMLLNILALGIGILFIAIFFMIMKVMMRLAENNAFDINETVGKTADVYLTVPAGKSGKGKVLVSVRGSVHELSAMTKMPMEIKSGQVVRITSVIDSNTLLVEPISVKIN